VVIMNRKKSAKEEDEYGDPMKVVEYDKERKRYVLLDGDQGGDKAGD
jgi:hypothetical protein